ncbi:hypothetical protein CsatA_008496 [Cannabis sativa]
MLLSVTPFYHPPSPMERDPSSSSGTTKTSPNTNTTLNPILPPGFRFHPSDQELIVHYLKNKVASKPLPASFIADIDLYKYNPWELPKKAAFGEEEWYFFSPRDRKYPKGERPNRAAGLGYWKATGIDKPIFSSYGLSKKIGVKKALVFYAGRPPKGEKTDWSMNEYRLLDSPPINKSSRFKGSMRLDDWVLCRVRYKGNIPKHTAHEIQKAHSTQPVSCLPQKAEEISLGSATANRDQMITDYIYKDCILLAWILAGQSVTPMETIPRVGFTGSNNSSDGNNLSPFSENGSNGVNGLTVSSVDNSFNIQNGETSEEKDSKYVDSKTIDPDLSLNRMAETDIWSYIQNQSQDDMYNANLANELALTGIY